eukprot:CAMPEP_0118923442 /NCGR_PEP_ID=MMETSP1169-20130426/1961_1 /TAXON_ID=36882 /ORGANISM="Pyramimonas obovata, Strain CCMP722" /LENGTH=64 /DNA_ID=CAMNT_0006864423 /DNA_START=253 /DNA_END=447 /DNA_ORIENTATION=+
MDAAAHSRGSKSAPKMKLRMLSLEIPDELTDDSQVDSAQRGGSPFSPPVLPTPTLGQRTTSPQW